MRTTKLGWLAIVISVLCTAMVFAQDTASLTGTVRDQTGAVIAGAAITVKNTAQGFTRNLRTNAAGEYVAAALLAGRYDVTVTAPGFRKYQAEGVILRVAQDARIDVMLQIGNVNSQVTVQGEGLAQVDTQSSQLGGTVTGKELTQLELNGRNFTQLVTLVPGVSNQTQQDEGVVGAQGNIQYSINGGRTEYNNWEIDGGDDMDNGSNFSLNVYPSMEAIEEVQVLTSNYGAQYGRNGSGTIEVETKSGTNEFHGSVYEFARNEAFNAHNYFDVPGSPKAGYKKHDFGYSLGGPIWKNHTFFFWSQEWRREVVPFNFFNFVPSMANRQGNFTDVCSVPNPTDCPASLPNFQVPSIDPNALALLPMIPEPNLGSGADSVFSAAIPQPTHWREELVRVDHEINSKLHAMFRVIHDSWDTTNATVTWGNASFPTIGTHFIGPGVSLVSKLTATVSPTLLNEFVASYTTDHIKQINTNPAVWTRGSNCHMTGLFPNFGGKLPGLCLNTLGAYGGSFCEGPTAFPWQNSNPTYTLRDNVSKSLGKHKLEFGGYYVDAEKNELAYTDVGGDLVFDSTVPVSSGNAFADLLMGNIASFTQASAQPKYHINYKMFEPFLQDDYHIAKNLTLNLGLRVSLFGTFWEKNHLISNWDPAAYNRRTAPQIDSDGSVTGQVGALIVTPGTNPFDGIAQCGLNGIPRGCLKGHLFNPAPRVGFAWDPLGTGKMAIRGAYGVFFEHTNGMEANAENLENTPPIVQQPTQYNVVGYQSIGGQGLLFPISQVSIPDRAQWPYVQQWHLDVQHELIRHAVATVSYVGSKGTHLTLQHELNQLHPITPSQNPFLMGQPITNDICSSQAGTTLAPTFVVNGNTVTGQPAINLPVACGNDPDPFRPYYSVGSIQRVEPVANSNYNALQLALRKTGGALTLAVAYTYSHSLDDSSDNVDGNFVNSYDLHKNYASSNFDQRHILTVSWVFEEPFFKGKGLSHRLLGGWQYAGILTSQSGVPFSVGNGGFGDSAGVADGISATQSFADIIGDPHALPANLHSGNPAIPGPLLFNPNAYVETQGLTFGDSGRNSLNMPHRTNVDMALYKIFKPKERIEVQFRVEAFNVFNHTQWAAINSFVGTDNFMYPSRAHMPRVLQLALRVTF
ncbi:MAG: carboxypeptidase regulatory-like domain-containing protein [Acidobacteria bacterium]|nr:carboxypeptidase regulatory-like domain-containing protein [Acidobacteriota bacterium]